MTKLTCLFLLSILTFMAAKGQISISGKIADTAEKKALPNSNVLLLRQSDSVLIKFTRTTGSGEFRFSGILKGKYLLLVTYPAYADYVDELEVKDSVTPIVLPPIGLELKSKLLEAVVVNGSKGSMRIKGDTTEFNADSFKTAQGATVEDLLKKLPGIQVDHNGQITAQGETVKKVLVDGEEFFGDDPTLVTKNLTADMVDKVQVYDKKSDQATFTGIDDGQREKTINLKLKNNKKNGYFGRLTASGGTDGYFDEELMADYFRQKEKLAVYGILSNTGKTGLNWQDRDTYGQSFASNLDVDQTTGSISYTGPANDDLDSWNGQYSGQGFPTVKTGGAHFNNKWDNDLQSLNGNYKYMNLSINGNNATNSEVLLPDTFYYSNATQKFNRQIIRHSVNGVYDLTIDSTSSIKLQADGGTDHKIDNEYDYSEALASDSSLVNQNTHTISTTGDNRAVNSNLLWRKKLGKPGRTLSFNIRENYTDNTAAGYLYSNTEFYTAGLPGQDSLINQYKNYLTQNTLVESKLLFTQPVGKGAFLGIDYGVGINNTHSNRNSYNKSGDGKYDALDSIYSNNYQYNIFTQRGGLSYTVIRKKFRLTAANDVAFAGYRQHDLVADTSSHRNFVNWYPNAGMQYTPSPGERIGFNYFGNTTPPTLQQLQPIANNENPLNVVTGNPGLKPQFANNFRFGYNNYKVFTDENIYAHVTYSFTLNAISSALTVDDTTGRQTTQSVNVHGNYSYGINGGYNFKIKGPDFHLGFGGNAQQNNNVTIVDNVTNATRSGTYGLNFSFWKFKEKKYDLELNFNANYTTSKSSDDPTLTTHYFTYDIQPSGDVFLPLHMQVHADGDFNIRQKTPVFTTNNDVFLINAWIGKKLLKNDQLMLKAAVDDLLNQNNGFSRNVSSSIITQNTYSTIKRYFMFSVVWNFTKAGTPAPRQD